MSLPVKNKNPRQFKGLSLDERKSLRRQKLIEAGLQAYGTHGFFAVTVKEICTEAKLTERYFYESFKRSEELFKTIYLNLVENLQENIVQQVNLAMPNRERMIEAGLATLLHTLQDDPRIARILFIDAILVQELHGQTIHESISLFDRTIFNFLQVLFPKQLSNPSQINLLAAGLNGYVMQIAMRWVVGGFKQPVDEVLHICKLAYLGIGQYLENPHTSA